MGSSKQAEVCRFYHVGGESYLLKDLSIEVTCLKGFVFLKEN